MLENRLSIQNSFDFLRKSGEKKDVIQRRHAKFYSYLRKISYSNVVDRGSTSYMGATMPALEGRIWTPHGSKPKMSQKFLQV